METTEHHLPVTRTARYYTTGSPKPGNVAWLVLHGYGQLAKYFIRHFAVLEDHFVVAPEALSRYYLPGHDRVGASWMTREDRETEIIDYLQYLDDVYGKEIRPLQPQKVIVLGFSQGAATAARWAAHTQENLDHLVLWGGFFPPDMHWERFQQKLQPLRSTVLIGNSDAFITAANRAEMQSVLEKLGIAADYVEYEGGHEIDAGLLTELQQKITG